MMPEEAWEDQRLQRILKTLIERTRAGRIHWEHMTPSPRGPSDTFAYSTSDSTIVIGSSDIDGNYPFLELLDSTGVPIERLARPSATVIQELSQREPGRARALEEVRGNLRYLYTLARRTALNVSEAIDRLMVELEEDSG